MQIEEDSNGRIWSSKQIFYACLRFEKPFLPFLVPIFFISLLSKLFFKLPVSTSSIIDLFLFLPFIGPLAGAMSLVFYRIVPNRWTFTETGISIKGREFKTISWNKIIAWSVIPVEELTGYHLLQLYYNTAKENGSCIIIKPTYPIDNIKQRLTKRCKGPAGSAVFRNSALLPMSQVNQSSVL